MGYDGSLKFDTKLNSKGFNDGTKSITQSSKNIISSLKAVGVAIGAAFIVKGIMNTVKEAEKLQNAMTGLKSIMDGQGKSYSSATNFIKKYTEDGLIPQTEAITAYKNLALRGYDTTQIQKVMEALKDSATFGRQSSYSLGEAVASASEGLKNENSILVDNAGVTKNVAKMWDDYAKSIGTTSDKLTKQQKIQAEVNGILEETKFQTGDAIKYADTYSGMVARMSASWMTFKQVIGGAFMQILQAIMPIVQTIINYLIQLANVFAQVVSLIFGKQVKANDAVAKSSKAAASGIASEGNAAEKAGKQAKGATLEFDNLNILQQESSSGSSAGTGGADIPTLDTLGNTEIGNNVTISPKIGQAFEILKNLYNGFIGWVDINFEPIFDNIAEELKPKIETLKGTMGSVFSDLGTLTKPLEDYFNNSFTPFLQQTVENIGVNLGLLLDTFNTVFSSLWDTVIFPVFEKFITVILPLITDFATQVQQVFQVLGVEITNTFLMLYTEGIEPVLALIVKIWSDIWDLIKAKWDEWGKPIFENIKSAVKNTFDTIKSIWETILKPVWDEIMKNVDWLWTNHLKPLLDNFLSLVAEFVNGALEIYNKFILPLINWLVDKLGPTFSVVFGTIAGVISSIIGVISDVVSGIITVLRGIIQFITGVFTGDWGKAWGGIVNIFKGLFEGIGGILKGILNVVIDIINGALRLIGNGINTVLNKINGVTATVGINAIPTVSMPQIPKLATGAVIPPNAQFMAILGDQKNGRNIEAPEDLIRQIVREEGGGNKTIINKIYLDGRQVAETVNEVNAEDDRASGDYTGGGTFAY